jgi:TonB-linked SusC/RagA family outer membrane protein
MNKRSCYSFYNKWSCVLSRIINNAYKRISLLFVLVILCSAVAYGQETVSGTVTEAQTGDPLVGVNILVVGTSTGSITNADGHYSLKVPSLQDTLRFSFIGYKTKTVAINGRTTINVLLKTQVISGQQMVVIGYGEKKKENLTGSVAKISGASLENQPAILTSSALMGEVAGVTVQQNSGQPGHNAGKINIRGITTLNNSNPLVLIDGVPGSLDNISSDDIENISVLKDAAAASIYGSRAASGVILVTTKRGQMGKIEVNYNSLYGWNKPTRQPKYVNAGRFMKLENLAKENVGQKPVWSKEFIKGWENNHLTEPNKYPNTNWVKELFVGSGFQQKQSLNLSGGTERVRFFGSLNYDEDRGTIKNQNFKRYSIRVNTDIKMNDKLSMLFDLHILKADTRMTALSMYRLTGEAYRIPPIYAARYTNGGWGPGWVGRNPVADAEEGGNRNNNNIILVGKIGAKLTPIKGLEFDFTYAPNYNSEFNKRMRKTIDFFDPETGKKLQLAQSTQISNLQQKYIKSFEHNVDFKAQYKFDINNHSFNVLGGYELIDFQTNQFSAFRDHFPLQNFEELDSGSPNNQQNGGNATSWALKSYFGRLNYNYKTKYLFQVNVRYDGSSRFSPESRWGVFPSFSAAWNISKESFLKNQGILSNLKLRFSWGTLGNQNIAGNFPYTSLVQLNSHYIFNNTAVIAAKQQALANKGLRWEKTTTLDIGTDMRFLTNKVEFTFDWYKKNTDDILIRLPLPKIIGLEAPFQNAGVVRNTGWELSAKYHGVVGQDFNYNIAINLSNNNNKVMDLKGAGPFIEGDEITKVGSPINSIYGLETDGLFQSKEDIENHASQTGFVGPGDLKYVDNHKDGIINGQDRVIIGDPFPHYNYGINIDLSYKNMSISALFQGVGKRNVYLRQNVVWAFYNAAKITKWQAKDFWTPDNKDASYPRLTAIDNGNNFKASDFWVYSGAYLRLRNLKVAYSLPVNLVNNLSIRSVKIFVLGKNLATWFDGMPPGIDPNVPTATNGGYYPINRMFSFGINIKF